MPKGVYSNFQNEEKRDVFPFSSTEEQFPHPSTNGTSSWPKGNLGSLKYALDKRTKKDARNHGATLIRFILDVVRIN